MHVVSEYENIRLISYPSLSLTFYPYTSSSSFSSFSNSLFQLSEWEYRSYFHELLTNITTASFQENSVSHEVNTFIPHLQPFLQFIFYKTSSKILITLIFESAIQLHHARAHIFKIKYHLISTIKVLAKQYHINPLNSEKYLKNRSLWIRNLPSKILELSSKNLIVSQDDFVWKLLSKISNEIERIELLPSKMCDSEEISIFLFQMDMCIRFRTYDECLRVMSEFCGTTNDPNFPFQSLFVCQNNNNNDTPRLFHLHIELDEEGYLRTHERHQRQRRRELSVIYQQKIENYLMEIEGLYEKSKDKYCILVNQYHNELAAEENLEKSILDVELSFERFTNAIGQIKQQIRLLADKYSRKEYSQMRMRIKEVLTMVENSVNAMEITLREAFEQQKEKLKQIENKKQQIYHQEILFTAQNLLQKVNLKFENMKNLTEEHDHIRTQYHELLSQVDKTWMNSSNQFYYNKIILLFKQSNSLIKILQKLFHHQSTSSSTSTSFERIEICCKMLQIEWNKIEIQINSIQSIIEIEINICHILDKILYLLQTLHSLPIRTILFNSLNVISNILQQNISLFEFKIREYSSSEWFHKILNTSLLIHGLVEPIYQYLQTTEQYMDVARTYKNSLLPLADIVNSSLNSTQYRLIRLESLAQIIINRYWSTSKEENPDPPTSTSSATSTGPTTSSSKEILSFLNSCSVSYLELSSILIEIEKNQMNQEDVLSHLRQSQEIQEIHRMNENCYDMSLEDERSYLCDQIWKLEKIKEIYSNYYEDDRWIMEKVNVVQEEEGEEEYEEEGEDSYFHQKDSKKQIKRKRMKILTNSRLLSQVGNCTTTGTSNTSSSKGIEEEMKLRQILLERFSKKQKLRNLEC